MENEIMNEETFEVVEDVVETVAENKIGLGKIAAGAGIIGGLVTAGYWGYKGVRWAVNKIKEKKAIRDMEQTLVIDKRTHKEDESK